MPLYKDQLQRLVKLSSHPKRIVSLVPSLTELLVDLGLGSRLVGVTKFCVHPADIRKKVTVIGGTKQVHIDKIKALRPDVVICNQEENTPEMVEALASFTTVHVSKIISLEDVYELLEQYGDLFGVAQQASHLAQEIQAARSAFLKQRPRKIFKVAYFIWQSPWMVVGGLTFVNTMLSEAGFDNVFANEPRYPSIELEHPSLQKVDLFLLSSEPFPFGASHQEALQKQFPKKQVALINGELMSWYGSRLLKSYDYFTTLYQQIKA